VQGVAAPVPAGTPGVSGNDMAEIPKPDTLEERLLLDRLNRMEQGGAGYYAVHIHLSDLKHSNRKPHFVRLAARNFDGLTNQHDSTLFQMKNADLVLLCRNVPVGEAEIPVEKVRALFSEDPLTQVDETGLEEDRLSTWYDLSEREDFAAFRKIVGHLITVAEETAKREAAEAAAQQKAVGQPLTAQHLTALSQVLPRVPLDDLIREQLCLHIGANGPEGVLFRESFVSIGDLKKRVAPGVNLFSSTWLFQYLTEALDRVVLASMAKRKFEDLSEPLSLNLNIGTVLSRDFQSFHRAVAGHADKVIVEMQVVDIFTDVESFHIARQMLQQNGYRVLVDGISPVSMQFFDPAILQADFIKIGWGKEFERSEEDPSKVEDLRRIIRDAGRRSIILSRVDSENAIQWGLNLGITRFQGFLMDRMIDAVRAQGRRARLKRDRYAAAVQTGQDRVPDTDFLAEAPPASSDAARKAAAQKAAAVKAAQLTAARKASEKPSQAQGARPAPRVDAPATAKTAAVRPAAVKPAAASAQPQRPKAPRPKAPVGGR